ncbi:hypothetical protein A7982_12490 [Minicystis rosea]|nr:hypothetical protein A7982_12490 [Minicystis rosea]
MQRLEPFRQPDGPTNGIQLVDWAIADDSFGERFHETEDSSRAAPTASTWSRARPRRKPRQVAHHGARAAARPTPAGAATRRAARRARTVGKNFARQLRARRASSLDWGLGIAAPRALHAACTPTAGRS